MPLNDPERKASLPRPLSSSEEEREELTACAARRTGSGPPPDWSTVEFAPSRTGAGQWAKPRSPVFQGLRRTRPKQGPARGGPLRSTVWVLEGSSTIRERLRTSPGNARITLA